ncbi:low temperature requirement protein A [Streptococcus macacae]|uniref:Low temperature requirement protein LtrA n=1 Tax=Streptococcus macacae NCTC 11558 TaxID=764298 RepID=G5JZ25_9STRE|nr:low temperature requirement protein A [Streptococcus macacae]EHJ52739.1 low temperature requirement protein LtrA [Streptococcus macacae NCTC 11558]SUN78279.1 putative low temperature requirement A protein [Streptococcus macacae NCTC 11558]
MSKHKAKRVSNYELFFDLAVVLAIGQLTSAIHVAHVGINEIISFLAGCVIILNIWNNEAFYYNKYGDSRRADIYSVIVLMLWVGNLALAFNFDISYLRENPANVQIFNTMLILCYGTIAVQYYLKGRALGFTPDIKTNMVLQIIYLIPLIPVATGLWNYSYFVIIFYFVPLFLPQLLRLPFINNYHGRTYINFPHAVERNQLLTILTFGESVIGIIRTYPLTEYHIEGIVFFLGMATLFIFYMTQTFININHHQKASVTRLFYSHALIIIGLLFFTVGLEFLADHHHHDLGALFFIGSVFTFYIGVLSTSAYNQEIYKPNRSILRKYSITLILGILAIYFLRDQLSLMGVCLVIMNYIMMRLGLNFRRQQREKHNVPHPDPRKNLRDFS